MQSYRSDNQQRQHAGQIRYALCRRESGGLLSVQLVNSLAWESNPSVSYSGSFSTLGSTG